jgi:N-methylhydantoinase B
MSAVTRNLPGDRKQATTEISPLVAEIIEGTIESAKMEMEAAIDRTARSLLIKEQHDYRTAIFDANCNSVCSVSFCAHVDPIPKKWALDEIHEGDIFIWNDPYLSEGGIGHLPDIAVTRPVFYEDRLIAYVNAFGHVEDMGGMLPGGMPAAATEIFQEGLMIPPLKLYDRGVLNESLYELILRNTRFPETVRGDVDAELASLEIGVERIKDLCRRYGADTVEAGFKYIMDRCARTLQEHAFPLVKDGEYYIEDFIEWEDITPEEPRRFIRLATKLIKRDDKVTWDFTGTDPVAAGSINWPGNARFYEKLLGSHFRTLYPELVVNHGVCAVTEAIVPENTIISPKFPAATSNRMWPLQRMYANALALLNLATEGCACDCDTNTLFGLYGYDEDGNYFFYHELPGAGQGGRPFADGLEVGNFSPESRNTPAEISEGRYPIIQEACDIRKDSGGAGRFRGGNGLIKDVRLLVDADLTVITGRYALGTWGAHGGKSGAPHLYIVNPGTPEERRFERGKFDKESLKKGDLLRVQTAGGGGWGDPLDREPERVLADVARGLVSEQRAASEYGVVVREGDGGFEIDGPATEETRRETAARRADRPMIDRGPEFDALVASGAITLTCDEGFWSHPDQPR